MLFAKRIRTENLETETRQIYSCLFRGDRQVLVVFQQMPYFLQHFSKNWVKTLVHGTLHKKLLISRRSTSFGGFSANAILFATFL